MEAWTINTPLSSNVIGQDIWYQPTTPIYHLVRAGCYFSRVAYHCLGKGFCKDKAGLTILAHYLAIGQAAHGGKKLTHGKVFKIKGLTKLLSLKEQKSTLIVDLLVICIRSDLPQYFTINNELSRHAKSLFLSGIRILALKMSGQPKLWGRCTWPVW